MEGESLTSPTALTNLCESAEKLRASTEALCPIRSMALDT